MLRRRALLASAAALAAPALVPCASLGQALRKVKLGSAFTTTTNAMFLMPDLLRPEGIDAEVITFPSLVQRMAGAAPQAIAVVCTNLRAAPLAPGLEAALRCPVYDFVAAALRKGLRLAGCDRAGIAGWGSLFALPALAA